jgi:hypothetical protein
MVWADELIPEKTVTSVVIKPTEHQSLSILGRGTDWERDWETSQTRPDLFWDKMVVGLHLRVDQH